MILSKDDLKRITGYVRKSEQIDWLRARGWVFEINGKGEPIVAVAYANHRLGAGVTAFSNAAPDFSAIR